MKYLITGGAGFIGNALALKLSREGHEVVVIDNFNDYYEVGLKEARIARLPKEVVVERMDIGDAEALDVLFDIHQFDAVCHLAAQAGVRHSLLYPQHYIQNNYVGTFTILETMRAHGVKKLVFASTSSVYGEESVAPFKEHVPAGRPVSVYAATKRAGELLTHAYHHLHQIEVTNLRFFTVYGPWGRPDMALHLFTDNILKGEPITVFNEGNMRRDFTYIDDVIHGIEGALTHGTGCGTYNLGRGESVSLMDFITAIETAAGMKATINYAPMHQGDVTQTYADISAAKRDLGYTPKTSVNEGIHAYVEWFRNYYGR